MCCVFVCGLCFHFAVALIFMRVSGRHCCWCCSCIDPCCEGVRSRLGFLGLGVASYFKFTKLAAWTMFCMTLCVVPMILVNTGYGRVRVWGTQCREWTLARPAVPHSEGNGWQWCVCWRSSRNSARTDEEGAEFGLSRTMLGNLGPASNVTDDFHVGEYMCVPCRCGAWVWSALCAA